MLSWLYYHCTQFKVENIFYVTQPQTPRKFVLYLYNRHPPPPSRNHKIDARYLCSPMMVLPTKHEVCGKVD